MLIRHIKFSSTMSFFKDRVLKKYGLDVVENSSQPCVMWGIYKKLDYDFLRSHKAPVILVFRGGDANKIGKFDKRLLKKPIRIYAPGIFISRTLSRHGIRHYVLPLTGCPIDIDAEPRGDHIYHYGDIKGTSLYGNQYLEEIEKRTGLSIIKAYKYKNRVCYGRDDLLDVYRKCFIGLRLTLHDGLPNTVLELGMMGRRSIYNGDIPHSIKWSGIDDICNNIMREYDRRHECNKRISKDIKNHINVGAKWLEV